MALASVLKENQRFRQGDAFWAAGFMGQNTKVIPSRDSVIVRLGPSPGDFNGYIDEVAGRILEAVPRR